MLVSLGERVRERIRDSGPMGFEEFVEMALYDPEQGFYATSGRAGGRAGDFITSVEVGPLFAAVVGDWLDGVWRSMGEPADFRVSEVGAGVGTLFRGINKAAPACFDALTYTLVEQSAPMRVAYESLPSTAWRSADQLSGERQHVVLANELLDNLPFGIAERVEDGWATVRVAEELSLVPDTGELVAIDAEAPLGSRVPIATAAANWVEAAKALADRVLVFDYAATSAQLAERGQDGWLRTYSAHMRGTDPMLDIGSRDITHDVPIDQLPDASAQWTQAEWLRSNGIDRRVETARQVWTERAHIGDLQAMVARSAIGEADALTDPASLGAFTVLEWR